MMKAEGLNRKATSGTNWTARAARASIVIAGGLLVIPAFTTQAAFQDIKSLSEDSAKTAHLISSSAASPEAAKIASVDLDSRDRLPRSSHAHSGGSEPAVMDRARYVFDAPEETRILRAEKGGRVVSAQVAAAAFPEGFSAGSVMERHGLLGSVGLDSDRRVRTAFAKISDKTIDAMTVAMNFQLKGTPDIPPPGGKDAPIMLASLKPSGGLSSRNGDVSALGYAPATTENAERASTLFESILKQTPEAFVPPIGEKDHAWAATPLPASAFSAKEQKCLAEGLYFEARGESVTGQAAVAQVILNRVRNPAFPNTICGVVYQNKHLRNRCQFSFACDGIKDRIADRKSYATAKRIAEQVTKGQIWLNEVGSATHYHANYVHPRWAGAMERVDRIGKHLFYRTYNGGW